MCTVQRVHGARRDLSATTHFKLPSFNVVDALGAPVSLVSSPSRAEISVLFPAPTDPTTAANLPPLALKLTPLSTGTLVVSSHLKVALSVIRAEPTMIGQSVSVVKQMPPSCKQKASCVLLRSASTTAETRRTKAIVGGRFLAHISRVAVQL